MEKIRTYFSYLLIFVVLAAIIKSLFTNSPDEQEWSNFIAAVVSEKVLCVNSGNCTQEFYVIHEGAKQRLSNSVEPWLNIGERVIVNRHEKQGSYRSGSTVIRYHYARRESPNK